MCEITKVGYFIRNLSCMSEAGIKFFPFASHSGGLAPPFDLQSQGGLHS